jgi:hypothetical protein
LGEGLRTKHGCRTEDFDADDPAILVYVEDEFTREFVSPNDLTLRGTRLDRGNEAKIRSVDLGVVGAFHAPRLSHGRRADRQFWRGLVRAAVT